MGDEKRMFSSMKCPVGSKDLGEEWQQHSTGCFQGFIRQVFSTFTPKQEVILLNGEHTVEGQRERASTGSSLANCLGGFNQPNEERQSCTGFLPPSRLCIALIYEPYVCPFPCKLSPHRLCPLGMLAEKKGTIFHL